MPHTSESKERQDDSIQSIFGASEYLGKFIRLKTSASLTSSLPSSLSSLISLLPTPIRLASLTGLKLIVRALICLSNIAKSVPSTLLIVRPARPLPFHTSLFVDQLRVYAVHFDGSKRPHDVTVYVVQPKPRL